ncbi:MAG: hypothetical protein GF418_06070 [Chitinivibrionales bacterium]|nr:hypothetical protein [Chitinivibrionales bacterium]MBD3395177.1 hypothetical protein [Chitinivibrionales bacterium]
MNKLFALALGFGVAVVLSCADSGNPSSGTAGNGGTGADSLASIADSSGSIDTGGSYTRTGDRVTFVSDSGDTTLTVEFTSVNDSQAVARLDTALLPADLGSAELVFERVTGSGGTLEDELWRMDSVRITSDSLGIDISVPVGGDAYFVLDAETGDVLSSVDTTETGALGEEIVREVALAAVVACPLPVMQAAAESEFTLLSPVDSVDASRSTCDTTWGYKSGDEVYITSDGVDTLIVHDAATDEQKSKISVSFLAGLMEAMGGGGSSPSL